MWNVDKDIKLYLISLYSDELGCKFLYIEKGRQDEKNEMFDDNTMWPKS